MNVLIAASYKAPQGGNFIPSLLKLSLMLREQGDRAVFVFPESENAGKDDSWCQWLRHNGFAVYLIDKEASEEVLLGGLLDIINKHEIDILHVHFGIYNRVIHRFRKKIPAKILIHDHFGVPAHIKKTIKLRIRNIILSAMYRLRGIHVVAVSRQIASSFWFARSWHVPNGLSLTRHVAHSKSREETRAALGLRQQDKACMLLGWSLDVKGLDIALRAVEECRKQDPDILLCVVGFGSAPNARAVDYISQRTDIDPYSPWIRYWEDTEDIFSYHRAADAYLSCSRTEGFSYGVLEAISQNTPLVLSDIRGTRWAAAYDHSFVYPVEDPAACARSIEAALRIGRTPSNYETVIEAYDLTGWCEKMIRIYRYL